MREAQPWNSQEKDLHCRKLRASRVGTDKKKHMGTLLKKKKKSTIRKMNSESSSTEKNKGVILKFLMEKRR